jgi:hypothetical protein
VILAHGIGSRSDLPVPLWLAVYAAAAAVIVSFFAAVAFWPSPRLDDQQGRALPGWLARLADSPRTRAALRVLGVLLGAAVLVTAWAGPESSATNPAPTWFYVWFWVGLVPVSILFGPVWRLLNPLRAVTIVNRGRPLLGERAVGIVERAGYWPAVVSLAAFLWLELVYTKPDSPRVVAMFITGYALVHAAAGLLLGARWFDRCDGFEAYSNLLARLAPFGRRDDGVLVLRNPLAGLAGLPQAPGLVTVVCLMLGSTAFDGLSRTPLWRGLTTGTGTFTYLALGTVGLACAVVAVAVIYHTALALTSPYLPRRDPSLLHGAARPLSDGAARPLSHGAARPLLHGAARPLSSMFVHSLIPVAVGYTIAHYFSLAVFQGQAGVLLATDPLGLGWNLLGTAGTRIDYTVVSTSAIALLQVGAIVTGHVVGVVAAHDRAVGLLDSRHRRRGQYPLLAVMVAYTSAGIALLVGT